MPETTEFSRIRLQTSLTALPDREEYRTIRPAFRWRQVVGLARVTTSAYGYNREDELGFRAAGYEDACKLLGVEA